MQGKVIQGTLVARFVRMNHIWSNKRDHLYRNRQKGAVFSRFEIERRERDRKPPTVEGDGFA